jgi:hypothetical protein
MSKYFVVKLVANRFRYYFQGLDAYGKPKWNGLTTFANQYGKITAIEIQEKLINQYHSDEYDIMPVNNQN